MKTNETTIASWQDYSILKVKPSFGGRHFYYIARCGRCISRTFNTKRVATKALRRLQSIQPYPILDAKINWLEAGISQFGHSGV